MRQDHDRFNSLGSPTPAPGGARLGAFIVDLVTIGVITSLASALGAPKIFESLLSVLYFVVCHSTKQQTLGKHLFGLKIISTVDETPSPGRILLRETIGRFLSAVVLLIGYLRGLFAEDSRTFHDMLAGTQVVSIRGTSRFESSVLQPVLIGLGVLATFVCVGIYVVLFTSVPLKSIAKQMELSGFEVEGIKGSLARGFSIERLGVKNAESGDLELNQVEVSYDLFSIYKDDRYLIKNISVNSGYLKMHGNSVPSQKKDKAVAENEPGDQSRPSRKKRESRPIVIERIDIANLQFEHPKIKPFTLKRFFINEMHFAKDKFSVDQVWIDSEYGSLNIGAMDVSNDMLTMSKLTQGTVKTGIAPELIKKDITLEALMTANTKEKDIKSIYVALFDRRIQIKNTAVGYSLNTYAFTPSQYFPKAPPLYNITLSAGGNNPLAFLMLMPTSGSFYLRSIPFKQNDFAFTYERGGKTYSMNVNWAGIIPMGSQAKPSLSIQTTEHASVEEWLSDLYYAKKHTELDANQRLLVSGDAAHFKSLTPSSPTLDFKFPRLTEMQPASSTRYPAASSDHDLKAQQMVEQICKTRDAQTCARFRAILQKQ